VGRRACAACCFLPCRCDTWCLTFNPRYVTGQKHMDRLVGLDQTSDRGEFRGVLFYFKHQVCWNYKSPQMQHSQGTVWMDTGAVRLRACLFFFFFSCNRCPLPAAHNYSFCREQKPRTAKTFADSIKSGFGGVRGRVKSRNLFVWHLNIAHLTQQTFFSLLCAIFSVFRGCKEPA